jgi:hypothetical protein
VRIPHRHEVLAVNVVPVWHFIFCHRLHGSAVFIRVIRG